MLTNLPRPLMRYNPDGDAVVLVRDLPSSIREDIEDAPFWKEVVAFANTPRSELDRYDGRYVAIRHGHIVDSDYDEAHLADRFYQKFGFVTVYIHKVGVEDALVDIDCDFD